MVQATHGWMQPAFFSNLRVSAYSGFSLDCYNESQTYQLQSRFAQHYYQLGQAQEFKMFEVHPERHLTDDGRPCTTFDLRDQTLLMIETTIWQLPCCQACVDVCEVYHNEQRLQVIGWKFYLNDIMMISLSKPPGQANSVKVSSRLFPRGVRTPFVPNHG